MSLENAKKFVADIESDESLQKIIDESTNEFLEKVKKLGYDFTEEELDEVSLENVAGGRHLTISELVTGRRRFTKDMRT